MPLVTIRPKYPGMLPKSELEGLSRALSDLDPTLQVTIDDSPVEHRVCVAFHEVITIVGPWLAAPMVNFVVEAFVHWAKRRFVEKRHRRPKSVTIFGPDNRVLAEVKVVDPDTPPDIWTSDSK